MPLSIKMGPATARAGVILGCMGNPSIFGTVVPLTLREPFGIGVAVTSAAVLEAAAAVAFAWVPEALLTPTDEDFGVASLGGDVVEGVIEAAAASLVEGVSSRGSTAYRWAVVVGQFVTKYRAVTAMHSHCARMTAGLERKISRGQ